MTERNFGDETLRWIGIVTNVMDPHQSGRVQVRVFGLHDDVVNIPDEDLPWAQIIQPVTSAARGRIGTAPVGLVVGSRVVGYWLDSDQQYPIVLGTVGRAGSPVPGQTTGGAPTINTAVGSIPGATQNSASNPYTRLDPTRVNIRLIDSGSANIDEVELTAGTVITDEVESTMRFPTAATTASAGDNETNILAILNQVDPNNTISSLQCLVPAATQLSITIDLGSIAAGFINLLVDALNRAIIELMELLGINSVLRGITAAAAAIANFADALNAILTGGVCAAPAALNSMAAGTQALARSVANFQTAIDRGANSAETLRNRLGYIKEDILARAPTTLFAPVSVVVTAPTGFVQNYYAYDTDPYPGYIRWTDPTGTRDPVFTLRNGQPNYISAVQHTSYDMSRLVQSSMYGLLTTGRLNTTTLQGVLLQAVGVTQAQALARVIGTGNPLQIITAAASLAPRVVAGVAGLYNSRVSISVLPNTEAIQDSVNRFTQAQTLLAVRRSQMENAFRRL